MKPTEYKAICEQPDVLSRSILQTVLELERAQRHTLTRQLRAMLAAEPITKPDPHLGAAESDYFKVAGLSRQDVGELTTVLGCAEAEAVGFDGRSTLEASRLGDLVDAWNRLLLSLE
jgi:hypothetical protein